MKRTIDDLTEIASKKVKLNPDEKVLLGEKKIFEGDELVELERILLLRNSTDVSLWFLTFVDFVSSNITKLKIYKPIIVLICDKLNNLRDYYVNCFSDFEHQVTNYNDIPYIYDSWMNELSC